jgi:hypothetical protein
MVSPHSPGFDRAIAITMRPSSTVLFQPPPPQFLLSWPRVRSRRAHWPNVWAPRRLFCRGLPSCQPPSATPMSSHRLSELRRSSPCPVHRLHHAHARATDPGADPPPLGASTWWPCQGRTYGAGRHGSTRLKSLLGREAARRPQAENQPITVPSFFKFPDFLFSKFKF